MSSPTSAYSTPFGSELDIETPETSPPPMPDTKSEASTPPHNALSDYSCASSEVDEGRLDTDYESTKEEEAEKVSPAEPISQDETETERRLARLKFVLDRSAVYSNILKERMEEEQAKQLERQAERMKEANTGSKRARSAMQNSPSKGKRKKGANGEVIPLDETEADDVSAPIFQQPALITGAKLKPYQLEGLQWMVSLDQNGISGILADEMGLGKTLQTIAFSAYLREHGNSKPFLVVCPLSVLHNWVDEYKKFAPDIPVCMYHGTPAERAELRRTVMAIPGRSRKIPVQNRKSTTKKTKRKVGRPAKAKPAEYIDDKGTTKRRSGRPRKSTVVIESDDDEPAKNDEEFKPEDQRSMDVDEEAGPSEKEQQPKGEEGYTNKFPIVLTTYDMIIRDRIHLQHYTWGYIVVDEGHRLKNMDCKLMREIKKYPSAGRMILTGTPLHNNLAELWSLLNFILPDIFSDLDSFQEWFNLPELHNALPTSQSSQIISSLHAILKPFLLRRMKVDVEMNLPPKKEYVMYAPLSVRQRDAYDRVLDGGLRKWLIQGGTGGAEMAKVNEEPEAQSPENSTADEVVADGEAEEEDTEKPANRRASKRFIRGGRKNYDVDGDDEEYFGMVARGEVDERGIKVVRTKEEDEAEEARVGREHQARAKVVQVNNMKLQNTVMQLRKVCSHPFLFDWPIDPKTNYPVLGEELVNASGKMMVLDRLLRELFKRGHKVLLFSQFTTMLDIIEDWAVDYMGWKICRIDGSTAPLDRREQMNQFQTGGEAADAPRLFLLSTRAGGLGINLVAADTVIFYDQDWNPQMDAQAQDRAHRIGQKRPVLIFRLVSAHTVETKIMQKAGEKRKLEALVIAKGKFKMPAAAASNKRETMAEMAQSLLRLEGEKIEVVPNTKEGKQGVLSDEDLDMLLDRRPEVFKERGEGWVAGTTVGSNSAGADKVSTVEMVDGQLDHAAIGAGKKAAFAVYQAPVEEGNEALANMLSEEPVVD